MMESMKMEMIIRARGDCTLLKVLTKAGGTVKAQDTLVEVE